MKTKTLIILVIVLALSLASCITAYASINYDNSPSTSQLPFTKAINDKELVYTMADGKSVDLTYEQSVNIIDGTRDVYLDADKNQYWIYPDGDVVGFNRETSYLKDIPGPGEEVNYTDSISAKNVIQIATMHCQSMYGDAFDDFKLYSCDLESYKYVLEFAIKYGINDCVVGATCRVHVLLDGTVIASAMNNQKEIENFDESVLENMTMDQINAIAEANARATYMDSYVDFNIVKAKVYQNGNSYSLQIVTDVFYMDETFEEIGVSETYYYGIS